MPTSENIVVTGASGQLGRLVIADLLQKAPSAHLVGIVRNPAGARELADHGVELRAADYDDPASITRVLTGTDKLLLISSSEIGPRRVAQHRNVIDAARAVGVQLLAYTSILHADKNPMALAVWHRETEALIRASGVPFVILRNGWYSENYTANAAAAASRGAIIGAARDGRISSAARADFAAAAAEVLANHASQVGKIYELAGDTSYTLAELAAEIGRQSGKPVAYKDLSEPAYKVALQSAGLAEAFAEIYAESDAKAAQGSLFHESQQLSRLIGRPTTTMAQSVAVALGSSRVVSQ
jgi:NAD(P)H dehydrogenase (quinone)